jgi:hypothetical protein
MHDPAGLRQSGRPASRNPFTERDGVHIEPAAPERKVAKARGLHPLPRAHPKSGLPDFGTVQ